MSSQGPEQAPQAATLTSLPRVEDLPSAGDGYDRERVREAFDAFRRHLTQLQAQLRVLQAAGAGAQLEPTGHAVRMDALHLIRAAAEFADTLERDAQTASAAQLRRTEEEVRGRQRELQEHEADVEAYRSESERQRTEIVNAAKKEARDVVSKANAQAATELREAEARGTRLLEQSRHQATELTNSARAEVEQTLDWARSQAAAIIARAQHGAEQLLGSAGMGDDAVAKVAEAILHAAEQATEAGRPAAIPAPGTSVAETESSASQPASRPKPTRATGGPKQDADDPDGEPRPLGS
jgi:F0F1-type ATP synthase membrane subunit b/b'